MKYKLINQQTKEEYLCQKVVIEGFDYYVSDDKIIQNDYYIDFRTDNDRVEHFKEKDDWVLVGICDSKKVLATNNPNINIPKVVDEVERLAKDYAIKEVGNWYNEIGLSGDKWGDETHLDFKNGYNHSQSTHPFSEEDVIEFNDWQTSLLTSKDSQLLIDKTTKELLQLWKDQRVQTIYFN